MDLGAPTSADLIGVLPADNFTINGGSVNFANAGGLAAGDFKLIDYNGNLRGSFANLTLGLMQPANLNTVLDNDTTNSKFVVHVTSTGPLACRATTTTISSTPQTTSSDATTVRSKTKPPP